MIFIWYNMKPVGFLIFFLTLRARGIRRLWRWRRTTRSPPLLLFTWLLKSLLSSFRWRTRLGRRKFAMSFPCLFLLPLFGLESRWITLCSIFESWQPSSSFFWLLLSHCTFLRLTSAILYLCSVKTSKV